MANSNFKTLNPDYDSTDSASTQYIDLDERFINDAWIMERFVGNNLWAWGYNSFGQLGLNSVTQQTSPVMVGATVDWRQISLSERHTAAIKTNGTLWAWGQNDQGQLGQSDRTHRSSPVQVGSLTNWKQVSAGYDHTAAVKTDGTLWAWGRNINGQLGLNSTLSYSSPTQVGSLTNWKQVSCGAPAGSLTTSAIKTDGTLWAWGSNGNGQLGQNNTTNYSSPVQVGTLTNWKEIAISNFALAVKTDGTLWAWGSNSYGQLGQNDTTNRSSPVQVGTLTNWKLTGGGGYYNCSTIKTDGTLWSWGRAGGGGLGLSDAINRSSPVQVGSLTNWKSVSGGYSAVGIKTDGTLWTWGYQISQTSSPVQVGTLTNWKVADVESGSALFITYTEIS